MRLIDADAFEVIGLPDASEEFALGVQHAMELLDKAPTVDAVEAVRCKDCKHMELAMGNLRWCNAWDGINGMGDDGFCNYGERKEKGDGKT